MSAQLHNDSETSMSVDERSHAGGSVLGSELAINTHLMPSLKPPCTLSLLCTHAGVWWSASESRVCQSFMKSIPASQVSFGRGVGQEGRSSGVKDNRIGWPVWVQYSVTQDLHFLSFLSLSTAAGLNRDLLTQLSST